MDDAPDPLDSDAAKTARERWLKGLPPRPSKPVRSGPVPPEVIAEGERLQADADAAEPSKTVRFFEEAMAEVKAEDEPGND